MSGEGTVSTGGGTAPLVRQNSGFGQSSPSSVASFGAGFTPSFSRDSSSFPTGPTYTSPAFSGSQAAISTSTAAISPNAGPTAAARSGGNSGGITTFVQQFGGFIEQLSGSQQQSSGYAAAGQASMAAATFNSQVVRVNLLKDLDALSREIIGLSGKQRTEAAASGFSTASKSFQLITHDTLTKFEREILNRKADAENKINTILFEGRSQQAAYKTKASSVSSQGLGAAGGQVPSLLQGVSNAFGGLGK